MYTDLEKTQVRREKVLEGISIILSLFSTIKQQRLFPRKIMTNLTKVQVTAYSIDQIIKTFEEANYEDCRINAYPSFLNEAEERDYENGINLDIFTPNILFIDLDLKDFSSKAEMDKSLHRILKHIASILYNAKPLVLWSGHGYHIIILVKATKALEHFEDFETLTEKPSSEFLQFAKRYLSLNKADNANNPAFKSCLLRVPYTFNLKCIRENTDPEVMIIRKFDSHSPLPQIDNLLVEFMTFLVDRKLKENLEKQKRAQLQNKSIFQFQKPDNNSTTITYIEKLLCIGLDDYRKNTISLILAPYFINILKLSDEESFSRIKKWVLKCNDANPLKPSIRDFDNLIKNAIKRANYTGIKPLKFNDTLQYKNKELFDMILSLEQ